MPDDDQTVHAGRAGRAAPACERCGATMRFEGGSQIHDVWVEKLVCPACGHEATRSYGRGSV